MRANFEHKTRVNGQRLADLEHKTAELERELSDARVSLERERTQLCYDLEATLGGTRDAFRSGFYDEALEHDPLGMPAFPATLDDSGDRGGADPGGPALMPDERTEVLVNHGRGSAYYPRLSRRRKAAIGVAIVAVLITILVIVLASTGPSWPSSVATVQSEAARACQNPDVSSEPGQVDFACAKATRQILWVFALLTSSDNPGFTDPSTGRRGLEPITPAQGGVVAWSLNLHHPYDPANPIDSLAVAARAINNIIGGATVTGVDGNVVVQDGLESNPANCVRYTGSAALSSHKGFPSLCARPVTSPAGQAALVAGVYKKWIVGASSEAAQNAAVLFENATNPGDPHVQAILSHLAQAKQPA
jgi:hypothetical protein